VTINPKGTRMVKAAVERIDDYKLNNGLEKLTLKFSI